MKKNISKLALTLGLILMFGANAWAVATLPEAFIQSPTNVTKTTGLEAGWYFLKSGDYCLNCQISGDAVSFAAVSYSSDLIIYEPTTSYAGSLFYVAKSGDNYTIQSGNGYYLSIDDANVTAKTTPATCTLSDGLKIKGTAAKAQSLRIRNGVISAGTASSWTFVKVVLGDYNTYKYTITKPTGVTTDVKITIDDDFESEIDEKTKTVTVATKLFADAVSATEIPGYTTQISVVGDQITVKYAQYYDYDVVLADDSPAGAGWKPFGGTKKVTVDNVEKLRSTTQITTANAATYIKGSEVDGYTPSYAVNNNTITITYKLATAYTIEFAGLPPGVTGTFSLGAGLPGYVDGNMLYTVINISKTSTSGDYKNTPAYKVGIIPGEVPGYVVDKIELVGTTITITYTPATETNYTVAYKGLTVTEGANFSIKQGADASKTADGKLATTATLSIENLADFIVPTVVTGYAANMTIRGTTVTIKYTAGYTDPDYPDLLFILDDAKKEASVQLANYAATSVTIPATIKDGTYKVTSIPAYGFTENYVEITEIPTQNDRKGWTTTNHPGIADLREALGSNRTYKWCGSPSASSSSKPNRVIDESSYEPTNGSAEYSRFLNSYNPNLRKVTFEPGCNITSIGNGAFEGCWNLESFVLPRSVTSLGWSAFRCCVNMTDFVFQVDTNGQCGLTKLNGCTFYCCESIVTMNIPEPVAEIGNEDLKYMLALKTIILPNTLKTIGEEFLCSSLSLQSVTIPANVTSIAGSAFHGCEALRAVYLLGPAAALATGSGSNKSFDGNNGWCADAVNNCVFYTTSDNINSYKNSNWSLIDNDGDTNTLMSPIPGKTRQYKPNQWYTLCLPNSSIFFHNSNGSIVNAKERPASYEGEGTSPYGTYGLILDNFYNGYDPDGDGPTPRNDGFGTGVLVAEMSKAYVDPTSPKANAYITEYTLIDVKDIKPHHPYLFMPYSTSNTPLNVQMWTAQDEAGATWEADLTAKWTVSKETTPQTAGAKDDDAVIHMIGQIARVQQLEKYDMYFKSSGSKDGKVGSFRIVMDPKKSTVTLNSCTAYWSIDLDGIPTEGSVGVKQINNIINGIDEIQQDNETPFSVTIGGIYDMNGRKLDVRQEQLPEGMYIMDGKKVLKK